MATASMEILACYTSSTPALGDVVRDGLTRTPRRLPPWLFYDEAGSLLFERITELPEYYLTRIERSIFEACAPEMIATAADGQRLRIVELGAGSAEKTRLLLAAAVESQGTVSYQPVDVSETALEAARLRLKLELPEAIVEPQVADYTQSLQLEPCLAGERRLVLYIGSSIGNFDPQDAAKLLLELWEALEPGDGVLLGVDLAPCAGGKELGDLLAAYNDDAGVTARFNLNLLERLNRELGAAFDLDAFAHRIRWNSEESRIEMHLESLREQTVSIPSLGLAVEFGEGETIHTENSYKYRAGQAEEMLHAAGFAVNRQWRDDAGWFAVYLALRR